MPSPVNTASIWKQVSQRTSPVRARPRQVSFNEEESGGGGGGGGGGGRYTPILGPAHPPAGQGNANGNAQSTATPGSPGSVVSESMFVDVGRAGRSISPLPLGAEHRGVGAVAEVALPRQRSPGVGLWALREDVIRRGAAEHHPAAQQLREVREMHPVARYKETVCRLSPTRPQRPPAPMPMPPVALVPLTQPSYPVAPPAPPPLPPPPPPVAPEVKTVVVSAEQKDYTPDLNRLSARCAELEETVADLESRLRQKISDGSDSSMLHLKIMAIEKKIVRQRLGQGRLAVHALQRRALSTLRRAYFWKWLRWAARRAAAARLLEGNRLAMRRKFFAKLQQMRETRRSMRRNRRVLRALHLRSRKVLLRQFYDRLNAFRRARAARRDWHHMALTMLLPASRLSLLRRAYRKLALLHAKARRRRELRPAVQALAVHNSRILLQRFYSRWVAYRLQRRQRRSKVMAARMLERGSVRKHLMQRYALWRAYTGRARKQRAKEALARQLWQLNRKSFLATYYRKLQRLHQERCDQRRLDALLKAAHGKWRQEHALPRLTTLESNITGLSTQLPQQTKRLNSLEAKLNALLSDNDQGLEAHLADLRARLESLGNTVTRVLEEQSANGSLEAQLAGLRTQYDRLSAFLDEMSDRLDRAASAADGAQGDVGALRGGLAQLQRDLEGLANQPSPPRRSKSPAPSSKASSHHTAAQDDAPQPQPAAKPQPEPPAEAPVTQEEHHHHHHEVLHGGLGSPIRIREERWRSPGRESLSPVGSLVRASMAEISIDMVHGLQERIRGLMHYLEERCGQLGNNLTEQMKQYVDLVVPRLVDAHLAVKFPPAPPPPIPPIHVPVHVPVHPVPAVVPSASAAFGMGYRDATEKMRDASLTAAAVAAASSGLGVGSLPLRSEAENVLRQVSPVRQRPAHSPLKEVPVLPPRRMGYPTTPLSSEILGRRVSPPPSAAGHHLAKHGVLSDSVQAAVAAAKAVAANTSSPRPVTASGLTSPGSPFSSSDTIQALRHRQRMRSIAFDTVLNRSRLDVQ